MGYLDGDTSFIISTCTWCGGRHEEAACPHMIATSGRGFMMADVDILDKDIALAGRPWWQEEFSLDVRHSAVLAYESDSTVLRALPQAGWGVDISVGYLEQDGFGFEHAVLADGAALSASAGILQSSMASPQLLESAYCLVDSPNVAFVGDALSQVCRACASVHVMAGCCPFEVSESSYESYRHGAVVRLTPEDGLLLDPQVSAAVLPVAGQGIFTVDHAAICGSNVGIYDTVVLASQQWDLGLERPGVAFIGDMHLLACVHCGSFHDGLACPSSLTLAQYEVNPGNVFRDWVAPNRVSLSEMLVPSWTESPIPPAYLGLEFGNNLASRVRDAVYEAVRSHGTVEGDLIVQIAVVVQAETGAINQIGVSYN